jgi:hypothetical protein
MSVQLALSVLDSSESTEAFRAVLCRLEAMTQELGTGVTCRQRLHVVEESLLTAADALDRRGPIDALDHLERAYKDLGAMLNDRATAAILRAES